MSRMLTPPFSEATAVQKVHLTEDGCNVRDPEMAAVAHCEPEHLRNRIGLLFADAWPVTPRAAPLPLTTLPA